MAEFWEPTPDILSQVEGLASRGLTQEQIAESLGIRPETLSRKKHQFDQLAQAIKKGQALGISHVANFLFDNAKTGNVTAQIFYLKCKGGWDDKNLEQVKDEFKKELKDMRAEVQECLRMKP